MLIGSANRGFTLIEVLVAIAIISSISFTPFAIISRFLVENATTEDRVQAIFMMQEVIEVVRFGRDHAIRDPNAGSWFAGLHSGDASTNEYSICVDYAENIGFNRSDTYCTVVCENAGVEAACTGNNGFVSGVSQTRGLRGNDDETCDGGAPKANNAFTVTLNVTIPRSNSEVQYASIEPCVSWRGRDDKVRMVEGSETIYEWLIKE